MSDNWRFGKEKTQKDLILSSNFVYFDAIKLAFDCDI